LNEPGTKKRAWHLLPIDVIEVVVDVFQAGALKPGRTENGWQVLPNWKEEYGDALMRHWAAYQRGETSDPDDGRHPLAHLLADGIILLWHAMHPEAQS